MKNIEINKKDEVGPEISNSIMTDKEKDAFMTKLRTVSKSKVSYIFTEGYYLFIIEGIPYGHLQQVKSSVREIIDTQLTDKQKQIIGVEVKVNEGKKFIKHI